MAMEEQVGEKRDAKPVFRNISLKYLNDVLAGSLVGSWIWAFRDVGTVPSWGYKFGSHLPTDDI